MGSSTVNPFGFGAVLQVWPSCCQLWLFAFAFHRNPGAEFQVWRGNETAMLKITAWIKFWLDFWRQLQLL